MKGKYKRKKQRKYQRFINKYKDDPVMFAEEMWCCKLLWYQKLWLKIMMKKERLIDKWKCQDLM